MTVQFDPELECWECGERSAVECPVCVTGEEYCARCLEDHSALEHEADDEDE